MDIGELLAFAVKNNASDLHLSAGLPPMIRVDGDVRRINLSFMERTDVQSRDAFLESDFRFETQELEGKTIKVTIRTVP